MTWKYYTPKFECDEYNRDMLRYAPWSGHRRFIYDFIVNLAPKTIVELGSFYGCSTFAIGQAIKDYCLGSVIWAVDFWDVIEDYTAASYQEDIYGSFLKVLKKCYGDYIKPLKMTFSAAREQFAIQSIDVLHIDGSHHYNDVKRDFEEWFPVVKKTGIILFHDIDDILVDGKIMGSHIFWKEIKEKYKNTLEFNFSCGLGILCLDQEIYEGLKTIDISWYQKLCNNDNVQLKQDLCKYSFIIRDKDFYISDLKRQLQIKDDHLNRYKEERQQLKKNYENTIHGKDDYIESFEIEKEKINLAWEQDRRKLQEDYEKTIEGKDRYIQELERKLREQ